MAHLVTTAKEAFETYTELRSMLHVNGNATQNMTIHELIEWANEHYFPKAIELAEKDRESDDLMAKQIPSYVPQHVHVYAAKKLLDNIASQL